MPEPLLKIQNLSFSYDLKKIIDDLTFDLSSGEVVSLVGLSGTGKSTLFKILAGLLKPDEGKILFSGNLSESISYMIQEDLLLPWRTVWGNLMLLTELGESPLPDSQLEEKALDMLSKIGLDDYVNYYPEQLSGGMRQRVSLARCLLQKKPLLLLDEPFGALDVVLREQIYKLLRGLKTQMGCSILMVTHDFRDAICLSDRILFMHEGTIHQSWDIDNEKRHDPIFAAQISESIRKEFFGINKFLEDPIR